MVAAIFGPQKRRNPGPGRSLRLGLLIGLGLLLQLGWAEPKPVTLGFVGDILPDRGAKSVIRQVGVKGLFEDTGNIFGADTDWVCANLEAAITAKSNRLVKTFRFNSPLDIGSYLHQARIEAVTLANNHSIDYGKDGLKDTVANLAEYQVQSFGYGANAAAALAPKTIAIGGVKIALIGAVCFPLEGYVYLPEAFDVGRWDGREIARQIQAAKAQADLVIVSLHWGIEFTHYPTANQVKMGRYCIDQGADLVIGHHPHVLQGMELYRSKPIFYSLGNFVFDQQYGPATESLFVQVTLTGKKISRISITPVTIQRCIPRKAEPAAAARIQANFQKYSQPFGLPAGTSWELTP